MFNEYCSKAQNMCKPTNYNKARELQKSGDTPTQKVASPTSNELLRMFENLGLSEEFTPKPPKINDSSISETSISFQK